jgi:hypothetical protein
MSLLNIPLSGTQINPLVQVAGTAGLTALTNLINGTNNDSRIRLAAYNPDEVYGNSPIMAPIKNTNGMMFPYTPTITYTQQVNYMDLGLVHSNTDYQAYTRTPSTKINLNGKFTVQSQKEGLYALAVIHFLRTASKSHFGEKDPVAGLPPPVLKLSGYGNYMFNYLNCILTDHSWTFDEGTDLMDINVSASPLSSLASAGVGALIGGAGSAISSSLGGLASGLAGSAINSLLGVTGGGARIPVVFNISCSLTVIQTPSRMRQTFNFSDFANGQLMTGTNSGWI